MATNSEAAESSSVKATQRRPRASLRLKIVFSVLVLAASLLGLECAVRTRDMFVGYGFFNPSRNKLYNKPDSIIPFRIFGVRPYTQPGMIRGRHADRFPDEVYRFEKPAGTFRIVCLGGSTTENKPNRHTHYPRELQKRLRERLGRDSIEVINIGNSAYATPHSLIHLELDVLSWDPDLLILSHNINDLIMNYFPDFKPDYSHGYSDPFFATPDYTRHFTVISVLLQHFQLYWLTLQALDKLDLKGRRTMHRAAWGDKPLPGLEVFRRNLHSFVTLAGANGIPVLLASQPLDPRQEMFDRQHRHKPYNYRIVYPLHEEYIEQHRTYNRTIEEVARRTGCVFLDNDAVLGGNPDYFVDHAHYTLEGVRRLADSFADFLVNNEIIK